MVRRSGAWVRATAILVLLALGPLAAALAAPVASTPCCAEMSASSTGAPAPCLWLAATSCCDDVARVTSSAPQPTPSLRAILLPIASLVANDRLEVRNPGAPARASSGRLALSTVVLLL